MRKLELNTEAGDLSMERFGLGIPATIRAHAVVEVDDCADPPLPALAQAGGAFDWLDEEPDLYANADLPRSQRG